MTTRARILEAAIALVRRGGGPVSMGAIAKAAGLSRQALYLTFSDKADLFVALVRYFDERRGLAEELAKIRDAPTGVDALMVMVGLQAKLNPGLKPLADTFELLRRQDPDVERAWQDRLEHRLEGCRAVVGRIAAEGRLRPGLDPAVAADQVWNLTSFRTWDDLVSLRGWSAAQYGQRMSDLLRQAIVA